MIQSATRGHSDSHPLTWLHSRELRRRAVSTPATFQLHQRNFLAYIEGRVPMWDNVDSYALASCCGGLEPERTARQVTSFGSSGHHSIWMRALIHVTVHLVRSPALLRLCLARRWYIKGGNVLLAADLQNKFPTVGSKPRGSTIVETRQHETSLDASQTCNAHSCNNPRPGQLGINTR